MNFYFLVEGKTERKVYPQWIGYLMPHLTRVSTPIEATQDNYFLISGGGYPHLLDKQLGDSVKDIQEAGNYNHFIVVLDADECTVEERFNEVQQRILDDQLELGDCALQVIVQNRCIETWFLGNRVVFSRQPTTPELIEFCSFYNVCTHDPEQMGKPAGCQTHAQYHEEYLKAMLREKNIQYTKTHPREVDQEYYLEQLQNRVRDEPHHLKTLQSFLHFCNFCSKLTSPLDT